MTSCSVLHVHERSQFGTCQFLVQIFYVAPEKNDPEDSHYSQVS